MTEDYRDQRAHSRLSRQRGFDLLRLGDARAPTAAAPSRSAQYLTQSPFTAEQIERFYGREAEVIGAPVDCDLFRPGQTAAGDYYLFCGRLIEPYKQVGIAIEAFRRIGARLVVAGTGPDFERLAASAPPNVEFVGQLDDDRLVPLMQRCRALVFPSRDDFGLIPVEAMACGRPVIAYAGGGSLYTSVPGVTGELFAEQTADAVEARGARLRSRRLRSGADPRPRGAVGQRRVPCAPRERIVEEIDS